jgi:hypothetical protein
VRAISKLWFFLALSAVACEGSDPPSSYSGDPDAGAAARKLDRSAFSDVGVGGRLDYATGEHWACRPDIEPNACLQNIDATEIKADGSKVVHKHEPAAQPAFDCFYVYPTVWISRTAQMTDFSDEGVKFVLDPLLSQAARFTGLCRLYAPLYRQAGLNGAVLADGADKQLALQDVRDAFAYYLEHDNAGRGFVLLGHSQGAFMLTSLISRDIDENSDVRERMISAVLLGAQPYAPPGEKVGGSFKHVEACREPGQTGCVIAYNSFASAAPPEESSLVGRVTDVFANEAIDPTGEVFCTEPAALAQNSGRYRGTYLALKLNNPSFAAPAAIPGVDTTFVLYRDYFRGTCEHKNGAHYLSISEEPTEGDARRPQYRNPLLEAVGFGTHLVDYGLALEDLLDAVALQASNMSR